MHGETSLQNCEELHGAFKPGDYVKVIAGHNIGHYTSVLGEGYGNEIEINYFEQKRNRWQLKDHAKDSREIHELEHANCVVDDIGHFHFLDIPKYMFLVVSFFLFFIRNNILHLSTSSFLLLFLVLFLKMSVDVPQNASTLEMHS